MIERPINKNFPWFTTCFSALLILIYTIMAFLSKSLTISPQFYEYFGAPYAVQIYQGHVYGVVFNNLIHINLLHLVSDLAGLWLLGAFLEQRLGWFKMAMLGVVCSVFGSIIQLALTDDPGLGISSALFGFYAIILVMSLKDGRFKIRFLYFYGILLLVSLILMIVNNEIFGNAVAVEAKIGGLIWGALMGMVQNEGHIRWQGLGILFIPFCIVSLTLVYAPWSSNWHCARGIYFHNNQQIKEAKEEYKKALDLDSKNKLASENYKLVKVDELSNLAYRAHLTGDYSAARRYYLKILAIKKNNQWARDNLKELP